jgi:hypothetical protein
MSRYGTNYTNIGSYRNENAEKNSKKKQGQTKQEMKEYGKYARSRT